MIEAHRAETDWIVEDVYGDLAAEFVSGADTLLWLDVPWSVCKGRIESRASAGGAYMNREQTERSLGDLVVWAEAYYSRGGWCSFPAHLALFNGFPRRRFRLYTVEAVRGYLDTA